jgi:hypothetical protein
MQHIGGTLAPAGVTFALLGPLVGCTLIWGSAFVAMICQTIITPVFFLPMAWIVMNALAWAYVLAAIPAAITGLWVALLSPFAPERSRLLAGAAAIGAVTTFVCSFFAPPAPGLLGGPLFLALVGAVSAFLCTWLFQNIAFKRDEMRRDMLARERADRLAKERAKAG